MKTRFALLLLLSLSIFSCKDNAKETSDANSEKVEKKTNVITLSNYSDENWNKGVGITYKMFLTDYSKEKEMLLKGGKEMVLGDGKTVLPIIGSEVSGGFIQIFLDQPGTQYAKMAEFPNEITIK